MLRIKICNNQTYLPYLQDIKIGDLDSFKKHVKPCTHVKVFRKKLDYYHHFLVTDVEDTKFTIVNYMSENFPKCLKDGLIKEENFRYDEFDTSERMKNLLDFKSGVYIVTKYTEKLLNVERQEAIRKIKELIGERRYRFNWNNCESLVIYALTGKGDSSQAKSNRWKADTLDALVPISDKPEVAAWVLTSASNSTRKSTQSATNGTGITAPNATPTKAAASAADVTSHLTNATANAVAAATDTFMTEAQWLMRDPLAMRKFMETIRCHETKAFYQSKYFAHNKLLWDCVGPKLVGAESVDVADDAVKAIANTADTTDKATKTVASTSEAADDIATSSNASSFKISRSSAVITTAVQGGLFAYRVHKHNNDLRNGRITEEEYYRILATELPGTILSGCGSLVGGVVGSMAIPIPFVGGFKGSAVGSKLGNIAGSVIGGFLFDTAKSFLK